MTKKHFIKFTKLVAKWFHLINAMEQTSEIEKAGKDPDFPITSGDVQKIIFDDIAQLFKVENDKFDNRIQFFKDHIKLKKEKPQYYSNVDVNFEKLLEAWSSPSPIDHFYQSVFGMSYAEKMRISELESAEKKAERGLGE